MDSGPEPHKPSADAALRARLQDQAYGSSASAAERARALAALDAIEQEERALIRARARSSSVGDQDEWELREAADDSDGSSSALDRRRPFVALVALLTAAAVMLTAIGAGLSLFF